MRSLSGKLYTRTILFARGFSAFSLTLCVALGLILAIAGPASGQVRFVQPRVNFGPLAGGPIYQHRFEFINEGKDPIDIVDIRVGCGCLQPQVAKTRFVPGERGVVTMQIRTLGQAAGERVWRAQIVTRRGAAAEESSLVIAAKLRFDVAVEPSIVAMTVETKLRQTIRVVNHRTEPLKVIAVRSSSPAVRILPLEVQKDVTTIAFEVDRANLQAKRNEETLDIYTDDPGHRHLQIPLTLIAAPKTPAVRAVPERVQLDAAKANSQLVRLRGTADRALRLDKAIPDHPALRCTWAAGPGNDATLRIALDPAKAGDATIASVRISFDEPAGTSLTIPVTLQRTADGAK